ncbi:MAG: hypothetical protein J0H74_06855 [Chitinophagaceae bacterium]|nr:hypothetical protein [Chitinophagaceae bacterium]
MKKSLLVLSVSWLLAATGFAQVGIGTTTPDSNSALEVSSTNKGFRLPQLALTNSISPLPLTAHVAGMMVYNTATAGSGSTAVSPGLYINDGTQWRSITLSAALLPPVAQNVAVKGTASWGNTLTASYTYYSVNLAPEHGTTYQWYRGTDSSGTTDVAISGATSSTYFLVQADVNNFVRVGVTPGAASGPTPGNQSFSAYKGPVDGYFCGLRVVTFTYNGASVTYGTIASPTTGVCFLDRNLGASVEATAYNDFNGYGDLFQWGRSADGHQLINWTASNMGTPLHGTTASLSSSDNVGNNLFIMSNSSPYDWRSPQNDNLWQGASGVNNPCPPGWYVPTSADWDAESGFGSISNVASGYTLLRLTAAGYRDGGNGGISSFYAGSFGYYWSSSPYQPSLSLKDSRELYMSGSQGGTIDTDRAYGLSVRCRR